MGGGPAMAGMDMAHGGKPGRRSDQPPPPASGINPESLRGPLELLDGVRMDLNSWNPKMHAPNPALWQHVLNRIEVLHGQLSALARSVDGG